MVVPSSSLKMERLKDRNEKRSKKIKGYKLRKSEKISQSNFLHDVKETEPLAKKNGFLI